MQRVVQMSGNIHHIFYRCQAGEFVTVRRMQKSPTIEIIIPEDSTAELLLFKHKKHIFKVIGGREIDSNDLNRSPYIYLLNYSSRCDIKADVLFYEQLLQIITSDLMPLLLLSPNEQKRQFAENYYNNGKSLYFLAKYDLNYKMGTKWRHFKEVKVINEN